MVFGLVQFAIAFSAYTYALTKIPASRAGVFLNLTPLFGLVIAFAALGEALTRPQLAGTMATVLSVSLIQIQDRADHVPTSESAGNRRPYAEISARPFVHGQLLKSNGNINRSTTGHQSHVANQESQRI